MLHSVPIPVLHENGLPGGESVCKHFQRVRDIFWQPAFSQLREAFLVHSSSAGVTEWRTPGETVLRPRRLVRHRRVCRPFSRPRRWAYRTCRARTLSVQPAGAHRQRVQWTLPKFCTQAPLRRQRRGPRPPPKRRTLDGSGTAKKHTGETTPLPPRTGREPACETWRSWYRWTSSGETDTARRTRPATDGRTVVAAEPCGGAPTGAGARDGGGAGGHAVCVDSQTLTTRTVLLPAR